MSYLNTHKHRQSSYLRAYYLRAYKAHSTIVENVRQISLFLQNKANVKIGKMNLRVDITKIYEISWLIYDSIRAKNKPNSNPIQSQTKPILAQYQGCSKPIKPNSNPILSSSTLLTALKILVTVLSEYRKKL